MKAISLVRLLALGALVGLVAISEPAQAQGPARGWGWSQGPAIEGDLENGKRLASAACAACHGPDGNNNDPQYPKLAGQSVAYLYRQRIDYQAGVRRSEVMAPMTNPLSLADMADLASFYSRQLVRSDAVTDKELADAGWGIFEGFRQGPAPPCVACHGSAGAGRAGGFNMMGGGMMGGMRGMADIPDLAGQHAGYVVEQLNKFESGQRPSTIMGRIAATLSDYDKKAVAEYVAGLR